MLTDREVLELIADVVRQIYSYSMAADDDQVSLLENLQELGIEGLVSRRGGSAQQVADAVDLYWELRTAVEDSDSAIDDALAEAIQFRLEYDKLQAFHGVAPINGRHPEFASLIRCELESHYGSYIVRFPGSSDRTLLIPADVAFAMLGYSRAEQAYVSDNESFYVVDDYLDVEAE